MDLVFSPVSYTFDRIQKLLQRGALIFLDPLVLVSGTIAGTVGRVVAPFSGRNPIHACLRRGPQWGLFFWMYVPLNYAMNNEHMHPYEKAFSTFFIGSVAGYWTRVLCNPVNRLIDESARCNMSLLETARMMKNKTWLQFYYTTPPLVANAVYCGALMTCFEGFRRFAERNGAPVDNVYSNALVNGISGGAAAATASTLTYPFSSAKYLQTVTHDSVLCRGIRPTLIKEVPMVACVFTVFSLIQPVVAPHHGKRVGFGY